MAAENMYRPVWSHRILAELEYHETAKKKRAGMSLEEAQCRAARRIGEMCAAFDDSEIEGWEDLEGRYGLPDPDDEHVVAAAVIGGAGAIVTANLRAFPADRLPRGLEAISAAEFASDTVELDVGRGLRAVTEIARRSGRQGPPWTVEEVLDVLVSRYGLDDAAALIRSRFPRRVGELPEAAVRYVAQQVKVDAAALASYDWRSSTTGPRSGRRTGSGRRLAATRSTWCCDCVRLPRRVVRRERVLAAAGAAFDKPVCAQVVARLPGAHDQHTPPGGLADVVEVKGAISPMRSPA